MLCKNCGTYCSASAFYETNERMKCDKCKKFICEDCVIQHDTMPSVKTESDHY